MLTATPANPSVLCLGGGDEFVAAARQAAPEARVAPTTLDELRARPDGADDVVALCDANDGTIETVRGLLDEASLPRFPLAFFSSVETAPAAHDALPRAEWTPEAIARNLRTARREHVLRRENARFRGDLATFGLRVAHDLRTPLGGVLTTTEMLREVLTDDAPGHVPLIQPIIDSTDGLMRLIERISFFAKASASREPARRFNVGSSFWNAFQQLERQIMKAGATLDQPNDWPDALGQPAWIEFVWRALLLNALQHGGPAVRIRAGWSADGGVNRFWLCDSGEVPDAKRATLFHPFNRLHAPGAPRGLGLPIVRRIVELQGGTCGFEPAPDGGSCFHFSLPPAPRAADSDPAADRG